MISDNNIAAGIESFSSVQVKDFVNVAAAERCIARDEAIPAQLNRSTFVHMEIACSIEGATITKDNFARSE